MLKTAKLFENTFANYKIATFIVSLDKFFIKLPHLPKKLRMLISKIVPFFALVIGIIGTLMSLVSGFFMVTALISSKDFTIILGYVPGFILVLLSALFLIKSFKPLRENNAIGWIYLFWAQIIRLTDLIIGVIQGETKVLAGILTIMIGIYLLFEIGQFYIYKNGKTA